ncbi:MAG: hypothetical protein JRF33_06900 [Deltaproteobacteria bacterium]|nr:hypothetical protein [Deltaproteobacteria bacterium]
MKSLNKFCLLLSILLALGLSFGACSGDDADPGTDGGTDAGLEDGAAGTDENVVVDDELSWLAPTYLDTTEETVGSVALAVHAGGEYEAAWNESQADGDELIMGRSYDGTDWNNPVAITLPVFSCDEPVVGFGSGGRAVLLYVQAGVGGMSVFGNSSDGQDAWGEVVELQSEPNRIPGALDMGGPVGVWNLGGTGGVDVWSVAHAGANWTTAVLVGASSMDGDHPRVAANNGGDGMAVWSTGTEIWAAKVNNGDQWDTPVAIQTGSVEVMDAEVAVDTDGNAVAVWRWAGSGSYYIKAATYTPEGGWGESERISTGGRAAGSEPVVAMDASGRAMVAWDENDGGSRWIFASRFIPGSGWSSPYSISREAKDANDPAISMNSNGKVVVVWEQEVGDTVDVWSARYLPEPGGWMPAEPIYTDDGWDAHTPKVALDEAGQGVAVWNVNGPETTFGVMAAALQ